jgi:hypothetical protein
MPKTPMRVIYFGDNKRPGRGLHETRRFGNELLHVILLEFDSAWARGRRASVLGSKAIDGAGSLHSGKQYVKARKPPV